MLKPLIRSEGWYSGLQRLTSFYYVHFLRANPGDQRDGPVPECNFNLHRLDLSYSPRLYYCSETKLLVRQFCLTHVNFYFSAFEINRNAVPLGFGFGLPEAESVESSVEEVSALMSTSTLSTVPSFLETSSSNTPQ